jgi:CheY-like chemotaxis protein
MQGSRKRILCIDNDEDTRLMISTLLELSGYTVTTSEDVAKGIRLARSERFDLYLLDYYFPDGSGTELCQSIRTFDTGTPIVFCSGYDQEAVRQEAISAGAQDYLVKPVDPEVLQQKIEWLLKAAATMTSF